MSLRRFTTAARARATFPLGVLLAASAALTACQQDALTAPAGRPAAIIAFPPPAVPGPVLAPIALPGSPITLLTGGVTVPVTTTFTDGSVDSTTAFYTASLDCGGGTAAGVGVTTTSPTAGTAGGSCTYTAPGVYAVSLTVTDGAGGSTTQTPPTYVVVYDAGAGFVTGGGWITSPAGAYAADPSLTGRANFGFVAKYQKGATVPTGQTEFQFQLGRLNFHSTAYEWLVVSGSRAQYKGQGTINGAGNYGFLITAVDGSLDGTAQDRFRIKLWDTSGAVVYDNQMGQGDTSGAATVLAGGAITIHK